MYYREYEPRRRGPGFFIYFALLASGLILGAFIMTNYFPQILDLGRGGEGFAWPEKPLEQEEGESRRAAEEYQGYQNTAVVLAAEEVVPAVVGITNLGMAYNHFYGTTSLQERSTGSGVIIDSSGYVVTNNHVIENAVEIKVTLEDGEEFPAEVIGTDPGTDLAVLKIDRDGLPSVKFSDSGNLRVGELAIAIGNPLGLEFQQTVTVGVISALDRSIRIGEHTFSFIQTDAAINDGNSGGPLINAIGEVVGINTAKIKIPGVEGMGFAIPSNTVQMIVSGLIEYGEIIRPWVGIMVRDVNRVVAEGFDLPVDYGVLVEETIEGSPAARSGIRPGDIIIQMGGEKINNFNRLKSVINSYKVGEETVIKIFRDGREMEVDLTFERLPEQVN